MKKQLFGTSGIRGDASKLFTDQFCFDLGRTFAKFLDSHSQSGAVADGMDPRGSSPRIMKAIEYGLLFENREVFDQGAVPVPAINNILLTNSLYAGSLMVSGSHIEPSLNGVKFFFQKEEILKRHEAEIEKIYSELEKKQEFKVKSYGLHFETDAKDDYIERLLEQADKKYPKWKVVVDPGNGAQSDVMPFVLKTLGLDVIELNCTIQGEFFARDTEVESDFEELKAKVKTTSADFGIGYDSDGDRVVFIDEKGVFIPGDFTCALMAKSLPGDKIVTPINSSQVIDHIGKKVIRTKVGSPYVVEEMKKIGASFGFEGNGGGIFPQMYSRDGGRVTIELLNILAKENKLLSELISTLPKFYIAKTKVAYEWSLQGEILARAKDEFKGIKVEEIDGLKIWLDATTWILFRSSQNAPEFRVFAESENEEKSQELLEKGINFVNNVIRGKL